MFRLLKVARFAKARCLIRQQSRGLLTPQLEFALYEKPRCKCQLEFAGHFRRDSREGKNLDKSSNTADSPRRSNHWTAVQRPPWLVLIRYGIVSGRLGV